MKKFFAILLLPFCLTSCDKIGTTKIKNLIDLTPKLEVETTKTHLFSTGKKNPFPEEKTHSYNISKRPVIAEPAIAQGVMYSLDKEGYVSAFSLKEKKILWTKDVATNEISRHFNSGGILFSDGKLYVTHGTRNLIILESANGNEIMRKKFPDILRSKPVMINDELLILQTISNQLIAYNVKTSKLVWMHEGGIEVISSKNQIDPIVNNGNILVSYSSGDAVYLNGKDGSQLWTYSISSSDGVGHPSFDPAVIVTKPIISKEYVYFATSNGKIVKLNINDGSVAWVKYAQDIQSMVLIDDNLIITNNARQVAILSQNDAKVNWIGNLISQKERNSKKPKTVMFLDPFVVKNDNNYTLNIIGSNGQLYQFTTNENGELPDQPTISTLDSSLQYYWISCCNGNIHLISAKHVKF